VGQPNLKLSDLWPEEIRVELSREQAIVIRSDGRVKLPEGVSPETAASLFWEALARQFGGAYRQWWRYKPLLDKLDEAGFGLFLVQVHGKRPVGVTPKLKIERLGIYR